MSALRLTRPFSPGIAIDYKKTEGEQGMLMNLHKKGWTEGLRLEQFDELRHKNEGAVKVRRSTP